MYVIFLIEEKTEFSLSMIDGRMYSPIKSFSLRQYALCYLLELTYHGKFVVRVLKLLNTNVGEHLWCIV